MIPPMTKTETIRKTGTCSSCAAEIFLVPNGLHFKWVTDPEKRWTWHCGSDPRFPTQAHRP